jgi:hypothetical protein
MPRTAILADECGRLRDELQRSRGVNAADGETCTYRSSVST